MDTSRRRRPPLPVPTAIARRSCRRRVAGRSPIFTTLISTDLACRPENWNSAGPASRLPASTNNVCLETRQRAEKTPVGARIAATVAARRCRRPFPARDRPPGNRGWEGSGSRDRTGPCHWRGRPRRSSARPAAPGSGGCSRRRRLAPRATARFRPTPCASRLARNKFAGRLDAGQRPGAAGQ